MALQTYGQALQQVFRDRDEGLISQSDFVRLKTTLLARSKCRLSALMPLPGLSKLPPVFSKLCDALIQATRKSAQS